MKFLFNSRFCLVTLVLTATVFLAQAQKNKKYSEDLSSYRPRVELIDPVKKIDSSSQKTFTSVTPKFAINEKVDAVLDSIDRFNLTRKYMEGFTIQIYTGQKRDDAMNVKKKMAEELPDMNAILQYQQPKFKVTVGKYLTRLEAQKDFRSLRRRFPSAILIPERILIR